KKQHGSVLVHLGRAWPPWGGDWPLSCTGRCAQPDPHLPSGRSPINPPARPQRTALPGTHGGSSSWSCSPLTQKKLSCDLGPVHSTALSRVAVSTWRWGAHGCLCPFPCSAVHGVSVTWRRVGTLGTEVRAMHGPPLPISMRRGWRHQC
uniref:Uncharacterized protein n=1 Tax=Coturnix japonica TaxID=93934 RepID=A0A8C2YAQ4_COTJA